MCEKRTRAKGKLHERTFEKKGSRSKVVVVWVKKKAWKREKGRD